MFSIENLFVIGFLILLEGILSIDNALVLAVLAKPLPKDQQKKALLYGMVGAVVFRVIAIFLASYLIRYTWIKFVGGGYLLWVAAKGLLGKGHTEEQPEGSVSFWKTVLVIELTDIAFALDSILAAVALTPKLSLIITGGIIGLALMRVAAGFFIQLLERFPNFEKTAYVMVFLIGIKVIIEALRIPQLDFHSSSNPGFIIFWTIMVLTLLAGFLPKKKTGQLPKEKN